MGHFLLQRLVSALVAAWLVATLVFALVRLLPGDPARVLATPGASEAEIQSLRQYLHLNDPLPVQYGRYMGGLLRGDLGLSLHNNEPVATELWRRFPATLEVGTVALVLATVVGIPLGVHAAKRRNMAFDHTMRVATLCGVGTPVFWLGLLLLWLFAYHIPLLPLGGRLDPQLTVPRATGFVILDALLSGQPRAALDGLRHLILPAVVLTLAPLAVIARLMRGSLLEVLGEDYILTARAKGLVERVVIYRHALKNGLQPVVTILGLQLASLLSGAILVESVFAWPGVGSYVYDSLQVRDYPVVQGAVILIGLMYVAVNTAVDICYGFLDPRIRFTRRGHEQ